MTTGTEDNTADNTEGADDRAEESTEESTEESEDQVGQSKGSASFCIPRAAYRALLEAKASAYEICAYLILARFTEETGMYSSASISAVNTYTGANKTRSGPIDRAMRYLKTIRASKGDVDMGPILVDRGTWEREHPDAAIPDGPTERGRILFILPTFDEEPESRIWFGGNLVTGWGDFNRPLRTLKNAGDVAARLLLDLYAKNDMEQWGGVRPVGTERGPWWQYVPVSDDIALTGKVRLIRARRNTLYAPVQSVQKITEDSGLYWQALEALESAGLIYEMVTVLNRAPDAVKDSQGKEHTTIPPDAEPLYELDCRSIHGYKPKGEEGIGGATAKTAGELGYPVATEGGQFDGTYAAIVPAGFPAMIAGVYRLRFRVANIKNTGVRNAWARIREGNREAKRLLERVRQSYSLPPL